jgi:ABC-2 type transport system ATP-binding protein
MTGGTPAIEACRLTKRYGDVLAVDRVDLRVEPGEVYALLGLNGAGKTTLILMLLGMAHVTEGAASLLGEPVVPGGTRPWVNVGYLVESPSAYPELTVRENLEVSRRLRRLEDRELVDEAIERLGLTPYARRRAAHLSSGNLQRLGLAKALLHRPSLLILDEPGNALDPAGQVEIRLLLRDLADARGTAVFLSSHSIGEVARTANRVGIVHRGRLLEELEIAELATRVRRSLRISARDLDAAKRALAAAGYRFEAAGADDLLVTDAAAVARPEEVATLLVRSGCPPTRLVEEAESLERYFLRLLETHPVRSCRRRCGPRR